MKPWRSRLIQSRGARYNGDNVHKNRGPLHTFPPETAEKEDQEDVYPVCCTGALGEVSVKSKDVSGVVYSEGYKLHTGGGRLKDSHHMRVLRSSIVYFRHSSFCCNREISGDVVVSDGQLIPSFRIKSIDNLVNCVRVSFNTTACS